jgi:hypothetical protein
MYGATLPSYEASKADRERKRNGGGAGAGDDEVIKADDPVNRERVRKMIESFE